MAFGIRRRKVTVLSERTSGETTGVGDWPKLTLERKVSDNNPCTSRFMDAGRLIVYFECKPRQYMPLGVFGSEKWFKLSPMKKFESLTEQEVLALAISLEE